MEVVNITIKNPKVISTNEMYMHPVRKTKNGRYMSFFTKSPALKELQEYYKTVLNEMITNNQVKQLKEFVEQDKLNGLILELRYAIPKKEIMEHDISNFIKSIEDCIVTRIKVDDSRNLRVIAEKQLSDSDEWSLNIIISTSSTGFDNKLLEDN